MSCLKCLEVASLITSLVYPVLLPVQETREIMYYSQGSEIWYKIDDLLIGLLFKKTMRFDVCLSDVLL